MIAVALAVVLSQAPAAVEPDDQISSHVVTNIRNALRSGSSAAIVTVVSSDAKKVQLEVNEPVVGTFPQELAVSAKAFFKRDLEPGSSFLVFFRGKDASLTPTGQYELVWEGKIREYPAETYLNRTRFEAAKAVKPSSKATAAKPAAPAPAPAAAVSPTPEPLTAAAPIANAGT